MANEVRSGAAFIGQFIDTTGTINFTAEFTNATLKYTGDTIDVTSGNDTTRRFLSSITQWTVSLEMFLSGTTTPVGTAQVPRFAPRSDGALSGTIVLGLFGSAVGQFKQTGAVVITSREIPYKFDDAVMLTVEMQGSGALTETLF